ncbi:MAG: DUF3096 domain-containing protein [Dehalococcoidia bacterium]|nr:DUF3096 domain-containing protein [Dehalococcoidia bacterium]
MDNFAVSGLIAGIISVVVGLIIMVWPRLIAYVIGIYLIVIGIIAIVAAV